MQIHQQTLSTFTSKGIQVIAFCMTGATGATGIGITGSTGATGQTGVSPHVHMLPHPAPANPLHLQQAHIGVFSPNIYRF